MATFRARMMDGVTGGERIHDFDAEDELMRSTPVRVIRKFMEYLGEDLIPGSYDDYELNAAFKNDEAHVVTGLGSLMLKSGATIPFLIMISPKALEAA